MNFRNLRLIAGLDARFHFTRPLFWVLVILLAAISMGLSGGNVSIQSGDTAVGADDKAWLTSEFSNALMLPMVAFIFYAFFVAVGAGMSVLRDDELQVGPILHSTQLTPREYIWGKFGAVLGVFLAVLAIHLLLTMFFNHLFPNSNSDQLRGPFELMNYLRPAFFMMLPFIVFMTGTSFAIGELTRRPILVFVMPIVLFTVSVFFLWEWSPSNLSPTINRMLMWLEPSGFRWINETWMKLDRGVRFYNLEPVGYDLPFLVSRAIWAAVGILSVFAAEAHLGATLRDSRGNRQRRKAGLFSAPATATAMPVTTTPLAALGMRTRVPGFVRTVLDVARFEGRNLASQPGLYIFVPLILMQVIFSSQLDVGAFDTPLLITPGSAAVGGLGMMTTLVCLLLLFYTVESALRETRVGLQPIFWAAPARTAAVLLGKSIANGVVGFLIIAAATVGSLLVILQQGKVALSVVPYALVWGALLLPTFLAWSAFVMFAVALTGSRYASYALGLAAIMFTAWRNFRNEMNWVGNWSLWGTATWTDFGGLDPNGMAYLINRVFWLAVMVFLVALTVRIFPRREFDSARILDRFRPRFLWRTALRLTPAALPAIVVGSVLWVQVGNGAQGKDVERRDKEYWGRNLLTWQRADLPSIVGVEMDLDLEPKQQSFVVEGHYLLENRNDHPLIRFPMSVGDHFEDITWKLNGEDVEPEHQARLYVFEPEVPIAPGEIVRVGFAHHGRFPNGLTNNGGGMAEFVLESGVVLTSFGTSFVPVPWFEEGRGIDEDNEMQPRTYEEGFWEGITNPGLGTGSMYPVKTTITGPDDYRYHAVGALTEERVEDGRRTVVWETDYPVNFFNVVAGKWDVWKGEGVEIYHHPDHTYNVEEMGQALEGARKYYSEWFWEYPWQDLRLNEFPALASYAQGFPTNITFSESIGFLTRSTPETAAAFLVTAHEAAHQWWGNILLPGIGPGSNILSEGMAHFSTILLFEQMKGERERIEFCKRIETAYGDGRRVDSELPLVWIDGSRAGDGPSTYNKGGWAMWMLHDYLGPEASLAGIRDFIGRYHGNRDHPVLQDFLAVMREHAADPEGYDRFVGQWYHDVVIPEYQVTEASKEEGADGWIVRATIENLGTAEMPLEVAATAGERWPEDDAEVSEEDRWRETRETIVIGAGETKEVVLSVDFEPDMVVVDPDAMVLMLERHRAQKAL